MIDFLFTHRAMLISTLVVVGYCTTFVCYHSGEVLAKRSKPSWLLFLGPILFLAGLTLAWGDSGFLAGRAEVSMIFLLGTAATIYFLICGLSITSFEWWVLKHREQFLPLALLCALVSACVLVGVELSWLPIILFVILLVLFLGASAFFAEQLRGFYAGASEINMGRSQKSLIASSAIWVFAVLFLFYVYCLVILELDLIEALAGLGVLSLLLTAGLKDPIANMFAGLSIRWADVIRPGCTVDVVAIDKAHGSLKGVVKCIGLEYTLIDSGTRVFVTPNTTLAKNTVVLFAESFVEEDEPEDSSLNSYKGETRR